MAVPLIGCRGPLRSFEGQEDPAANFDRVLQRLESRSQHLPLGVSEIAVPRTWSQHQIVPGNQLPIIQPNRFAGEVDRLHHSQLDLDVMVAPEN